MTERISAAIVGRGAQVAAGILFGALLALNLLQVLMRATGEGFIWVTDASQLMLLWMVMLGTVAAYCLNEHIVTGYFDHKLTGRALSVLLVGLRVFEIGFFLILIVAGYSVASTRFGIPYVQLGISTGWTYMAIPVAGVLLLVAACTRPIAPPPPEAGLLTILPEDTHDQRQ